MSKCMAMGMPLQEVIYRSTVTPARALRRPQLGSLSIGAEADVAILGVLQGNFCYRDCGWGVLESDYRLECALTLRAGQVVWDRHGLTCPHFAQAPADSGYWDIPETPVQCRVCGEPTTNEQRVGLTAFADTLRSADALHADPVGRAQRGCARSTACALAQSGCGCGYPWSALDGPHSGIGGHCRRSPHDPQLGRRPCRTGAARPLGCFPFSHCTHPRALPRCAGITPGRTQLRTVLDLSSQRPPRPAGRLGRGLSACIHRRRRPDLSSSAAGFNPAPVSGPATHSVTRLGGLL